MRSPPVIEIDASPVKPIVVERTDMSVAFVTEIPLAPRW
eukprot:SAG31_NODE_41450_length_276_cov_0.581921_1_plen_38_part_10